MRATSKNFNVATKCITSFLADTLLEASIFQKKILCLACGTEESKLQIENYGNVITIDAYLKTQGLKRVSVPSDGHCILHSWRIGLEELNIYFSIIELL